MARHFDGTSGYLVRTSAVLSTWPATLVCWTILDDSSSSEETLVSLSINDFSTPLFRLCKDTSDNVLVQTRDDGAIHNKNSGAAITTGVWEHLGMTVDSNGVPTPWLNGSLTSPGLTNTLGAISLNRTSVGVLSRGAISHYWDGSIAEVGIWNAELNSAEMLMLAVGVSPMMVRPGNLVTYLPLIGRYSPEIDRFGGVSFTVTGTAPVEPHPPMIYPSMQFILGGAVAAGDTTVVVPQESLTQADNAPALNTGVNVATPLETLVEVDNAPALNTGVTILVPTDTLAQVDNAPALNTGVTISVLVDTLTQVDNAPDVVLSTVVTVPQDSLSQTDNDPALNTGVNVVVPANDNLALTDFVPVITAAAGVSKAAFKPIFRRRRGR